MTNEISGMVIVDRGDGNTFQIQRSDLARFTGANPGARVVEKAAQSEVQLVGVEAEIEDDGLIAQAEAKVVELEASLKAANEAGIAAGAERDELKAKVEELEAKNAELVANALEGLTEGHLDAEWLADLKQEQLVSIAAGMGISFGDKATKADMAKAIAEQPVYFAPIAEDEQEAGGDTAD